MNREEALGLVTEHLKNKNLVKHCFAVEACMRAMAARLGFDPESWGEAGLIHDLDYEMTGMSAELHTEETAKILENRGVDPAVIHAVRAHAGKVPCQAPMDTAMFAIDPLTGLIVAAALMHPTKKIKNIDVDFVKRRYKEKSFAKGARREDIETCRNLGLELDEFIGVCLAAMQGIDAALGL